MTATWRDVELAGSQGSITSVNLNVPHTLSNWGKGIVQRTTDNGRLVAAWIVLLLSSVLLGFSAYRFIMATKEAEDESNNYEEPLVAEDGVTA